MEISYLRLSNSERQSLVWHGASGIIKTIKTLPKWNWAEGIPYCSGASSSHTSLLCSCDLPLHAFNMPKVNLWSDPFLTPKNKAREREREKPLSPVPPGSDHLSPLNTHIQIITKFCWLSHWNTSLSNFSSLPHHHHPSSKGLPLVPKRGSSLIISLSTFTLAFSLVHFPCCSQNGLLKMKVWSWQHLSE